MTAWWSVIVDNNLLLESAEKTVQSFQLAMEPTPNTACLAWLHDLQVWWLKKLANQLVQDLQLQWLLCTEVIINGVPAYTLFDSGCTTDMLSPMLAYIIQADWVDLLEQMGLQLETKGSHMRITHGVQANMSIDWFNDWETILLRHCLRHTILHLT